VEDRDGGDEGETADGGGTGAVEAHTHSEGGGRRVERGRGLFCVWRGCRVFCRGSEHEDEKKGNECVGEEEGCVEVMDTAEQRCDSGRSSGAEARLRQARRWQSGGDVVREEERERSGRGWIRLGDKVGGGDR
jgi:hypothetical protein